MLREVQIDRISMLLRKYFQGEAQEYGPTCIVGPPLPPLHGFGTIPPRPTLTGYEMDGSGFGGRLIAFSECRTLTVTLIGIPVPRPAG